MLIVRFQPHIRSLQQAYLAAKVSSSDIEPRHFPQLHGDLSAIAAQHGFATMQTCPAGKCPDGVPQGTPDALGCSTCTQPDGKSDGKRDGQSEAADGGNEGPPAAASAATSAAQPAAAAAGEGAEQEAAPRTTPAILAAKALLMPERSGAQQQEQRQQQQQQEEGSSGGGSSAGRPSSRRKSRGGDARRRCQLSEYSCTQHLAQPAVHGRLVVVEHGNG